MSSTQTMNAPATAMALATMVDLKVEVVVIPVADVDRAKGFYEGLGWRVDADFAHGDAWRLVQLTPPGSPCSVMLGKGFTAAAPGSVQGTILVVDDLDRARAELIGRGVDVSDVFHFAGDLLNAQSNGHTPGRDPQGRSYFSFASFTDPDGNGWLLQEVTTRFPGRGFSSVDAATMTGLLREAEARHGEYEATGPRHQWPEWYAEYIVARQRGKTADEAARHAALQIERVISQVRT
jgi:catechol 2,3-dioxygenase-like lactoylglutathione lyase family enzyme